MDQTSENLLKNLNLDTISVIKDGMESIVLEYDPETILKVSKKKGQKATIQRLKRFYDSLTWDADSPALPNIITIEEREEHTLTYEKKLPGTSVDSKRLSTLKGSDLRKFSHNYLDVLLKIRTIQTDFLDKAEPLNKLGPLIEGTNNDWNAMLKQSTESKYESLNECISRDLEDHAYKMKTLISSFSDTYQGKYEMIHGDFLPANLLVDENFEITAVIDFGILTTQGDRIFDLATGWTFFDMWREIRESFDHMAYLKDIIFERITSTERELFHRYLLVYSLISLDIYYSKCMDDHYLWCMRNLNDEELWKNAF